jgi:hypothetical protein
MKEKDYPIYDPLGMEIFLIDEGFESLFNGLRVFISAYIIKNLNVLIQYGILKRKTLFIKGLRK